MSMIEIIRDVKNPLLTRREITCVFKGLAGRLKKLEAADMITKQFNLEGKLVIPVILRNETGIPMISGTFYVYDDENLAKQHLKAAIFKRLEKAKAAPAKALAQEAPSEKNEDKAAENKELQPKVEGKPKEESKQKEEGQPKIEGKLRTEGKPKTEAKQKEDSK